MLLALFVLISLVCHGAYFGNTFPFAFLTGHVTYAYSSALAGTPRGRYFFHIDPRNLESFQLDIQFDPARVSFLGLEYVDPYIQTPFTSPDLSMLGSGLLQDVAGTSSIYPPPPCDVYVFIVEFDDLNPSLPPEDVPFTVFAGPNDFLVGVDVDTGIRTTYTSTDILPLTRSLRMGGPGTVVCTDSGSAMVNLGVLSVIALSARLGRMRVR